MSLDLELIDEYCTSIEVSHAMAHYVCVIDSNFFIFKAPLEVLSLEEEEEVKREEKIYLGHDCLDGLCTI